MAQPTSSMEAYDRGQIEVTSNSSKVAGQSNRVFRWLPSINLVSELPPNFSLELNCVERGDGQRCFVPVDGSHYRCNAWAGGLALLSARKQLSVAEQNHHRLMWFVHRRAIRSREHLQNNFLYGGSWRICKRGRQGVADSASVFPETIGLDVLRNGRPWDAKKLIQQGHVEAQAHGIPEPTEAQCLQYGLLRAARLNPLPLPEHKVRELIRDALYTKPEEECVPTPGERDLVLERLIQAFTSHLPDNAERFNAWFWGSKSNLIGQLAKKQVSPGIYLQRKVVHRIMLDLGWEASFSVAECMDEMLAVFRELIPHPLTEQEKRRFDLMHCKQPCFGGLPLVLIAERLPLVTPAIDHLLEHPDDPTAAPVLYRLMDFYAEMATARRTADRIIKSKQAIGHGAGVISKNVPLESLPDSADSGDKAENRFGTRPGTIRDFLETVRKAQQIICPCGRLKWQPEVTHFNEDEKKAVISYDFSCCDSRLEAEIRLSAFKELLYPSTT